MLIVRYRLTKWPKCYVYASKADLSIRINNEYHDICNFTESNFHYQSYVKNVQMSIFTKIVLYLLLLNTFFIL
jgi:hypothetical protein